MKFFLLILLCAVTTSVFSQQKIKVACIGDSITEGAGLAEGMTYPQQLQKFLGDHYEVRNYGVGGRTLLKRGDFPYWQEAAYKDALTWKPDVVIIKLGTNDSKPQNWIYSGEFETEYQAFIQSFKDASKPKIFICTPIPVFKDEWGITESTVAGEVVPAIKQIALTAKVELIDMYAAMAGKGELVPDGVHPNEAGATLIAEAVRRALLESHSVSR